ncbi:hypothetical protein [Novosphingobium pokkalii]|uniref:Inner membrane protein n=1 Tax=Novosphingobium pokkalii TaxID=1770194 RepID=A0ABV7V6W5_9SPHN|nr:hypothetical protein [Novosphingobium pokkalii]GHC98973.1 hypothetical protein GCM10019060_31310 [Novosphingobium pokkalii]
MQDTPYGQAIPPRRRGGGRLVVGLALIVVLALGGGATWFAAREGWLRLDVGPLASASGDVPAAVASEAVVAAASSAASDALLASTSAKVSALEQRLAEINQQANAAAGQATRAEALLVAFAARRAIERGQPLGILENQLRVRFGATQPGAVDRVIAAAAHPNTLGSLSEELAGIAPQLIGKAPRGNTWDWLSAQISGLFVIRHDEGPNATPEARADHARLAVAGGRVDAAISDVERMPGKDAATEWLAHARDWVAAQRALDQLETAAMVLPAPQPVAPMPQSQATPAPAPSGTAPTAPASPDVQASPVALLN